MDLIQMLLTGASIVRFANKFLNAFCREKNFVLCAIFIKDDGFATRYSLYQQQNDCRVCCALYFAGWAIVGLLQPKGTFVE
jgi:hypothetical protein